MNIFTPGVYAVFEPPSTRTISGAGTSTTAMVGIAEKGRTGEPVKLHNFTEFNAEFGDFMDDLDTTKGYLAYAAYLFFQNGGKTLYAVRLADGTGAGKMTIKHGASNVLTLTASGEGSWIKKCFVKIQRDAGSLTDFTITFLKRDPTNPNSPKQATELEVFSGLTLDSADAEDFVETRLANSLFATAAVGNTVGATTSIDDALAQLDASSSGTFYTFDSAAAAGDSSDEFGESTLEDNLAPSVRGDSMVAAKDALKVLDDIAIVAFPGLDTFAKDGQTFAKSTHEDSFFIADPPKGKTETDIVDWRNDAANLDGNEQSALYYPWLKVKHPFTGEIVELPPSGAAAGIFARTDNLRGVFKAPAGTESVISGAIGFETIVSSLEQESMNKIGVNALRAFAGTGNLIWGARTLGDLGGPFRYVPVMRYYLYLRKSLVNGTQFAVFEPNDERLWTTLRMTAEAFMMREFRKGAFQGTTPEACFFVKCDSETNPQADIDAGFVNLHIGYAPLKPAEFVMIRISHKSASAE